MRIGELTLKISHCTEGIYLRWFFNGFHYYNFQNGYDNSMSVEDQGVQVTRMFSRISKVEHPTKLKAEYAYQVTLEGIAPENILGFTGLLLAERVEQYEDLIWREVEITRGDHLIKDEGTNSYILNFEITRKELPFTPAVYQKSIKLYVGDTLCDLDTDEIIPINKQVNDIAEMQDRQSDFTAQFRIRKTRVMQALFELSGEVGATTTFPYVKHSCKLIQNGIEMITNGILILERGDYQYYNASILSGNLNFFKDIENQKITDLLLPTTNHNWTLADQKNSHDVDEDYLYPLCEPSNDGGILPLRLAGNTVEAFGGWIWPFVKVKAIWDDIFAPYLCEGDVLTNNIFLNSWMPITSMKINKAYTDGYLYSGFRRGYMYIAAPSIFGTGGTGALSVIHGTPLFATGHYLVPFTASVKIVVNITFLAGAPQVYLYVGGIFTSTFDRTWFDATHATHEWTRAAVAGEDLAVWGDANTYFNIEIAVVEIADATITYGSPFVPHLFLPDMTQIDFIKMICNMFGLIPDFIPRDHRIKFWNYNDLYSNIPIARDWSAYLSEREDETEFKFGDYAQKNYLKYKESDDVLKDNGKGTILVEDETLSDEKDVIELPVSTCDEVVIATTTPMTLSRIAFNEFEDTVVGDYKQKETIDARIVYCKRAVGREFIIWDTPLMAVNHVHVDDPKIACSVDVSFSSLVVNYASLSRMLTKTNLRRAKFHLPVYEVAGLKHYIPIYLSQYKAYFYVNKINNYVPGQLCTIDLIKL
jgi:hypothetical protein